MKYRHQSNSLSFIYSVFIPLPNLNLCSPNLHWGDIQAAIYLFKCRIYFNFSYPIRNHFWINSFLFCSGAGCIYTFMHDGARNIPKQSHYWLPFLLKPQPACQTVCITIISNPHAHIPPWVSFSQGICLHRLCSSAAYGLSEDCLDA